MYMIQVTENQKASLAENAEKVLRYAGKLMQDIEEITNSEPEETEDWPQMGYRRSMGTGRMGRRVYKDPYYM